MSAAYLLDDNTGDRMLCVCVCVCVCLSIRLSVCLFNYLSVYPPAWSYVWLFAVLQRIGHSQCISTSPIPFYSTSRLLGYHISTCNLDPPLYTTINCAVLKTDDGTVQLIVVYSGGSRLNVDQQISNKQGALIFLYVCIYLFAHQRSIPHDSNIALTLVYQNIPYRLRQCKHFGFEERKEGG